MSIDERSIFYEGKYIYLKVLDESDLLKSGWFGWFNNEMLCKTNQHHYFPNSLHMQRIFLEELDSNRSKLQLGIVNKNQPNNICGVVSLSDIDLINRNAEISGFQDSRITKDCPYIFYEAWSLLLKHAFMQLGLKKVYGGAFRPHSVDALSRAFNFSVEGVKKSHVFKDGIFRDVTMIAVFDNTVNYPDF